MDDSVGSRECEERRGDKDAACSWWSGRKRDKVESWTAVVASCALHVVVQHRLSHSTDSSATVRLSAFAYSTFAAAAL